MKTVRNQGESGQNGKRKRQMALLATRDGTARRHLSRMIIIIFKSYIIGNSYLTKYWLFWNERDGCANGWVFEASAL